MMMKKKDIIQNWSLKGAGVKKYKEHKTYKNSYINHNSQIGLIGPTGSGKTNTIIELISRSPERFYEVIYFTGTTSDEHLLNLLKGACDDVIIIDDYEDLPDLQEKNDDDKTTEKLIIFDDIICLPKKILDKISQWFIASRKYGYISIVCGQTYTDIPKKIREQIKYWIIFRLRDIRTVKQVINNHNTTGDNVDDVHKLYLNATDEIGNFFMIDLNSNDKKHYRRNFLDFWG